MNPKIQEHHRSKPAYIYLRQSTPSQVRHHQESTERQYALREKALELGWSESLIRTLDRDLGKTGTEMARRGGFKNLVAEGSVGPVGAGFAVGGSRLGGSKLAWARLLGFVWVTQKPGTAFGVCNDSRRAGYAFPSDPMVGLGMARFYGVA